MEPLIEPAWLGYAKRLQALASTGLYYGKSAFDRERYHEIGEIAHAMLADLGNVPIARIADLVPDFARGYPAPKVDVRGAVIDGDGVLLVRERSDGGWTLPGGFADIGISPARNTEKEVREEAGLNVTARRLYAVRHKASHPYPPDPIDFYKLFVLCDRLDDGPPQAGIETEGAEFFRLDALPPLSRGRTIEADLHAAFEFAANPGKATLFD